MPLDRLSLPLIVFFGAVHAFAQNPPTAVSVDASANRHPISPNIYGIAYGDAHDMKTLNAPLNRWGGNSTTRYNWQIDAHSAAADWYFETYSDGSGTPGGSADTYTATTRSANNGAEPLFTIPMIDWLANLGLSRSTLAGFSVKKYGAQTATDPWNSDAGNGVSSATGKNITGNNPTDTGVANSTAIQQAWVQHFVNTLGPAISVNGVKYYILDNEPSLWHSTHRDVHPNPATYQEMYDKIVAYATAIRAADPNAKIAGFEEWSWWAMYFSGFDQANGASAANSDYNTHSHTYYYPWLLQQLYTYKRQTGKQLIDILTVHCYNATPGGSDDSLAGQQARNRETRILWDPTFQDPSWYGDIGINGRVLNWIPTLKAMVNQYHPGLQIGCTEYNWGDEANLNGATTQADVLGIYGREGFDLATRWTVAKNTNTSSTTYYPTYLASQIYRNYDGNNSTFGDTSVSATVPNPDNLSTFAAVRSSDGALTVMVINKQQGSTPVTVSLANFPTTGTAQAWQINSASQSSIARLADLAVANNAITATVPSQSITLFVIPAGTIAPPPAAPTGLAATVGSGTVTLTWNASGGATSYTVKRAGVSGGPYATLGTTTQTTYADSGLTNGTTYYYVVSASNAAATSANSAELGATPILPPAFTSSATASPNPVGQGSSTTVTVTVTDTANALTNGIVQVLVADPGGATVASQNFTGQNFTAGQGHSYTLAFTPAASGSFRVRVGVFSATWQQWHWNDTAATITVTSSLTFTSSATATPSTVAPGSSMAIKATVTDTGTASLANANIEVQVFNSAGSAVSTNVWSGQSFTAGQSQQYSYTWSVPGSQATGTYTVMMGVFDATWTTNYYWNSNGATITVTAGQTTPAAPTGLTATPGSGHVVLAWTASSGAASYNVYRGTAAGAEGATAIATGVTTTSYADTGLTNGTKYFYKVAAVNAGGTSPLSNEASATPVAAVNVTSQVKITASGFTFNRTTKTYNSNVTIRNQTQQAIAGPIQLVLTNLPAGITLFNRTGTTGTSPFITLPGVSTLAAGQSATVKIEVQAASAGQITYTAAVYSGVF
jgi:fibronectin type 3 domain-containing protein